MPKLLQKRVSKLSPKCKLPKKVRQNAINNLETLKSKIESLQKDNESAVAEVQKIKTNAKKEKKSSMHAAATLAATNAARQAEMEMSIKKMQKEMDSKMREINTIKAKNVNKDETAENLMAALQEAKEDLSNYKEGIESKKEADALKREAHCDYFDKNEVLSKSAASTSKNKLLGRSHRGGLFGRLFNQSNNDFEGNIDWKSRAPEKDTRISELEQSVVDNSITIVNLKNELMAALSKFKEDKSQRQMLIQRLENKNQAYSIKIEVIKKKFKERCKQKDARAVSSGRRIVQDDDGSVASSSVSSSIVSTMASKYCTGVSSITGKTCLMPL
jgi:DNA repair exonuclease SbcCD ATPase subunit